MATCTLIGDLNPNALIVGLQAGRLDADLYLIDRVRGQWDFSETCRQVRQLHGLYPSTQAILVEEAANGSAIINVLNREISGVIGVRAAGGKYARAMAAQPMVEAGNVWLPNPRPHGHLRADRAWVEEFLDECSAFPQARHDDQVDAFTQLVARHLEPQLPTWIAW